MDAAAGKGGGGGSPAPDPELGSDIGPHKAERVRPPPRQLKEVVSALGAAVPGKHSLKQLQT